MRRARGSRRRRSAAAVLAACAVASGVIALHALPDGAGIFFATAAMGDAAVDELRGLAVAPEHRCTPYNRGDYPYSQSIEAEIVAAQGGRVYGPYTGRFFRSTGDTDIEHIVAVSEAHDSGLCAAGSVVRLRFASDLLNLTLAAPEVNRCGGGGKCGGDAAQWLPPMNRCWFAARAVAVKRKYRLTVDRHEAAALGDVLSDCDTTDMVVTTGDAVPPARADDPVAGGRDGSRAIPSVIPDALRRWDDNGNGRITCAEARRHGIAPVARGHPAYGFMFDRDGDGTVCE